MSSSAAAEKETIKTAYTKMLDAYGILGVLRLNLGTVYQPLFFFLLSVVFVIITNTNPPCRQIKCKSHQNTKIHCKTKIYGRKMHNILSTSFYTKIVTNYSLTTRSRVCKCNIFRCNLLNTT